MFQDLSIVELKLLRDKYNHLYYNTDNSGGVSDEIYDSLIDTIQKKELGYVNPVGATVKQNQVTLPYYLGSMNKCRDQKEIDRWVKKYSDSSYIIEEKLDGVSCLMIINGKTTQLFTRGDGIIGTDISHFSNVIQNAPKKKHRSLIAIRGELIMKKSIFNSKYKSKFSNPRNLISGIINSKTIKEEARDIDFIPYEIINNTPSLTIVQQFEKLQDMFQTIVNYRILSSSMTVDILKKYLIEMKQDSDYEMDGIIIHTPHPYTRNTSGNPDYAFAFKTMLHDNIIDTEVEFVEWNITKWNVFKPRIKIKPVNLCGVTIQYATGFNAKYIKENSIGEGAIVSITRSNDVIPYIVKVRKPGTVKFPEDPFIWNETGVDIILMKEEKEHHTDAEIKILASFFSELGVKHVSDATISKLLENGHDTLVKILNLSKDDFLKIDGFKEKLAERTFENIHSCLKKSTIEDAICASSCFGFGFGKKKIQKILQQIPDFYKQEEKSYPRLLLDIMMIEGFSEKTAKQVISHIPEIQRFVSDIGSFIEKDVPLPKVSEKKTFSKVTGKTIVFSGFRDKDLEELIIEHGGFVGNSVTKTTTLVVTKNPDDSSSKLKKARENKIEIVQKDFFEKNFFI
jgi:DNA ligase (NAD+)